MTAQPPTPVPELNAVLDELVAGIRAILVCHGRPLPDAMREAARRERIAIAVTELSQYDASWRLHQLLAETETP